MLLHPLHPFSKQKHAHMYMYTYTYISVYKDVVASNIYPAHILKKKNTYIYLCVKKTHTHIYTRVCCVQHPPAHDLTI